MFNLPFNHPFISLTHSVFRYWPLAVNVSSTICLVVAGVRSKAKTLTKHLSMSSEASSIHARQEEGLNSDQSGVEYCFDLFR